MFAMTGRPHAIHTYGSQICLTACNCFTARSNANCCAHGVGGVICVRNEEEANRCGRVHRIHRYNHWEFGGIAKKPRAWLGEKAPV